MTRCGSIVVITNARRTGTQAQPHGRQAGSPRPKSVARCTRASKTFLYYYSTVDNTSVSSEEKPCPILTTTGRLGQRQVRRATCDMAHTNIYTLTNLLPPSAPVVARRFNTAQLDTAQQLMTAMSVSGSAARLA